MSTITTNNQNQGASIEAERAACALEFGAAWGRQAPETQMAILSGWLAARRSVPPAAGELPPLPDGDEYSATRMLANGELAPRFTAATMQNYARQAIAADRAQRKQAGQVGVKTWQQRMPEPRRAYTCNMNCSGGQRHNSPTSCGDCMPVMVCGDPVAARDAEIADLRAKLAQPAEDALRTLCDQLDSMKRRLHHTPGTGQHHSYLMHEDVEAYVEQARKALGAQPDQRDSAAEGLVGWAECGCHACNKGRVTAEGWPLIGSRMILCPTCGNKRCPHASDHALACTGSNEPGQPGSVYGPVASQEGEQPTKRGSNG